MSVRGGGPCPVPSGPHPPSCTLPVARFRIQNLLNGHLALARGKPSCLEKSRNPERNPRKTRKALSSKFPNLKKDTSGRNQNLAKDNQRSRKNRRRRKENGGKTPLGEARWFPRKANCNPQVPRNIRPTKMEQQNNKTVATVRQPVNSDVGQKGAEKEVRLPAHPISLAPIHSQRPCSRESAGPVRPKRDGRCVDAHIEKEGDETFECEGVSLTVFPEG